MAAGQAGGPLYSARVWLETVTLPSGAGARTDAEIVRLGTRMNEVIAAARRGDQTAVSAALAEYERIADEALAASGGDRAATERLRLALDRHLTVLATVAAKVPLQARESIEANIDRAIEHNGATVDRMEGKPAPPASNGDGSGGQPAASAKPNRSPKPTAAATPERTPPPAASPHADPTQHVQPTPTTGKPTKAPPTPKPDKTPPAHGRSAAP
jgi:hypothetical protein